MISVYASVRNSVATKLNSNYNLFIRLSKYFVTSQGTVSLLSYRYYSSHPVNMNQENGKKRKGNYRRFGSGNRKSNNDASVSSITTNLDVKPIISTASSSETIESPTSTSGQAYASNHFKHNATDSIVVNNLGECLHSYLSLDCMAVSSKALNITSATHLNQTKLLVSQVVNPSPSANMVSLTSESLTGLIVALLRKIEAELPHHRMAFLNTLAETQSQPDCLIKSNNSRDHTGSVPSGAVLNNNMAYYVYSVVLMLEQLLYAKLITTESVLSHPTPSSKDATSNMSSVITTLLVDLCYFKDMYYCYFM